MFVRVVRTRDVCIANLIASYKVGDVVYKLFFIFVVIEI